jgi:hypothetical protein
MWKSGCLGAVLAVSGAMAAHAEAPDAPPEKEAPYLEKQTGIAFPAAIGDLERGAVKDFPEPGLGVGVTYKAGSVLAVNLFVYDQGLKEIPSDPGSEAVRKQADKALEDIRTVAKQGLYPNLAVTSRGVVPLTEDDKGPKAQRVVLSFGPEGGPCTSYIYVAAYRNRFVKLRYTYPDSARADAEKNLAALTRWLGEAIREKPAGAKGE